MRVISIIIVAIIFSATACQSTFDNAESLMDRTREKIKADLEAVVDSSLVKASEATKATVSDLVNKPIEVITKKVDALGDTITNKLPAQDRDQFKKDVEDRGLPTALKEWWVEILLSFLGLGGTPIYAWVRERNKRKQSDVIAKTVVQSVEEFDSKSIKSLVAEKVKGRRDQTKLNNLIQHYLSESK